MQKAGIFILLLFLVFPVLLSAQNEGDDPSGGSEWDYYYDDSFNPGDQTFIISLGAVFPMAFYHDGEKIKDKKIDPAIGGTGSLIYNYYINKNIFFGAEVTGMFFSTLGDNNLFIIPLGVRGGYQFNIWRLEFPVAAAFGMVWHRYLNQGYYGIYLKGGGAAFFRTSPNWSFGIGLDWFWLPQWKKEKDIDGNELNLTVYGNVLSFTLSARYHF